MRRLLCRPLFRRASGEVETLEPEFGVAAFDYGQPQSVGGFDRYRRRAQTPTILILLPLHHRLAIGLTERSTAFHINAPGPLPRHLNSVLKVRVIKRPNLPQSHTRNSPEILQ